MRPIKRYHFPELSSTNDKAKELSRSYAVNEYLAVTADMQTSGRGRNGKVWSGLHGENLYCSFAIRYGIANPTNPTTLATMQPRGALAVIYALRALLPPLKRDRIKLKYPNDVFMLGLNDSSADKNALKPKKICGILVEHEFLGSVCVGSVIGIGINVRQIVFPQEIASKASSLLACGIDVEVDELAERLLAVWETVLEPSNDAILAEWWQELALENVRLEIVGTDGEWKAVRLLAGGTLLVRNEQGTERIISNGDSLRRLDWA